MLSSAEVLSQATVGSVGSDLGRPSALPQATVGSGSDLVHALCLSAPPFSEHANRSEFFDIDCEEGTRETCALHNCLRTLQNLTWSHDCDQYVCRPGKECKASTRSRGPPAGSKVSKSSVSYHKFLSVSNTNFNPSRASGSSLNTFPSFFNSSCVGGSSSGNRSLNSVRDFREPVHVANNSAPEFVNDSSSNTFLSSSSVQNRASRSSHSNT